MRLFGKVDGIIDRYDRAEWMTPPFDGAFALIARGPYQVVAGEFFTPGAVAGEVFQPGAVAGETYTPGTRAGETLE